MSAHNEAPLLDPANERSRLVGLIGERAEGDIRAAAIHVSDQWWSGVVLVGGMGVFDDSDPMSVYNGSEVRLVVGNSFDGTRRLASLAVSGPGGTLRSEYSLTANEERHGLSQDTAKRDICLYRILSRAVFELGRAEAYRDTRVEREVSMREPRNAGKD